MVCIWFRKTKQNNSSASCTPSTGIVYDVMPLYAAPPPHTPPAPPRMIFHQRKRGFSAAFLVSMGTSFMVDLCAP